MAVIPRLALCCALACAFCGTLARPASAQLFENVGVRAQGMAGAFVAIADDASATWWNPAGLATGALFSGILERDTAKTPREGATLGIAFAVPSLGVSYYRLRIPLPPPANTSPTGTGLPTFLLDQVGLTFGQSVGRHLVVSSTVKLVHADDTRTDIDAGAMLKFGAGRLGIVVKHLYEPDVAVNGTRLAAFDRQVRVGAAYAPRPGAVTANVDVDADLTTTPTAFGNARHLAGGAELWFRKRFALRAGASVNTIDETRPSYSTGASLAVRSGVFLEGHVTGGQDNAVKGWGVALRLTY